MRERALRWYLAFSVVFFLSVAVVLVVRLTLVRDENIRRAERELNVLSVSLQGRWSLSGEVPPSLALVREDQRIRAVAVFRAETGVDYLWARSVAYLAGNVAQLSSPTSLPSFTIDQLTEVELSRPFTVDARPHVVAAVYRVLDRSSVFPLLRDSLIALLSFTLLTVLVAIVSITGERSAGSASPTTTGVDLSRSPVRVDAPAGCEEGVSSEESLPRKLTLELERSAFNEQDFSVAVLEFAGITRREPRFAEISDSVLDFFSFEDMIFAFGENQIVVLFPGSGLADTLSTVERFQRHFWQQRVAWGQTDTELFAGASSRNGRLVDGPRILHESEAALRQSYESSGHIVGFDPDPVQFRSYLTTEA